MKKQNAKEKRIRLENLNRELGILMTRVFRYGMNIFDSDGTASIGNYQIKRSGDSYLVLDRKGKRLICETCLLESSIIIVSCLLKRYHMVISNVRDHDRKYMKALNEEVFLEHAYSLETDPVRRDSIELKLYNTKKQAKYSKDAILKLSGI